MARSSPQGRYQDALRVVKRRLNIGHKEAQAVYRTQRAKLGPAIPVSKFENYSEGYLKRIKRDSIRFPKLPTKRRKKTKRLPKRKAEQVLFEGVDAAFDLQRLQNTGQVDAIRARAVQRLRAIFRPFQAGQEQSEMQEIRTKIAREDFWRTYHDMVREAIKKVIKRSNESPDAILVTFLGAINV